MADSKTYDSKPNDTAGKAQGDKSLMPQRHVLAQTGKPKTAAEAGASGKCSTPHPW